FLGQLTFQVERVVPFERGVLDLRRFGAALLGLLRNLRHRGLLGGSRASLGLFAASGNTGVPLIVMPGLDRASMPNRSLTLFAFCNSAWATGIGERSDAALRTAMPGGDEGGPPPETRTCAPVAAISRFRYLDRCSAPVAQLDRALPSEGRGQGFE